jgi:hypothetical protein
MATFIGIRSFINLNGAFEPIQKWLRFNRTAWKSTFFWALGASFSILAVAMALPAGAQSADTDASAVAGSASTVNIVRWMGSAPEATGRTVEMSFALYQEPAGGLALWSETQPVKVGTDGRYTVLLGATSAEGLSQTLFRAGEARWIEARPIQAQLNAASVGDAVDETANATPPARSLLAAVPYAFKSMDAETLDGRAANDYVTREDLQSILASQVQAISSKATSSSDGIYPLPIVRTPLPILGTTTSSSGGTAFTGAGTSGFLPLWIGLTTLGNSMIAESGTNVGIGTNTPATILDVNGASTLRGAVSLLAAAATLTAGVNSPGLQLGASTYSSASNAAVPQNFVWQAQSTANNTTSPSANLALLFGSGTATSAPTGLAIAPSGQVTFAQGQTFPGAGTIIGITTGPGLTGGGSSGNVTLALSGPVSTANGGTGAATPAAALANLDGISSTKTTLQTLAGPLSGSSIGIATTMPATPLDVNGASTLRGAVSLPASTATANRGADSPPLQLGASSYSSVNSSAVTQNFVWQAVNAGNDSVSPTANLKLLFGAGTTAPASTGLSISPNGQITFAQGQMFPGTSLTSGGSTGGSGTISGVVAGAGLTGGGSIGNVTLALSMPISAANGGTGAATAAGALANLGGQASLAPTVQLPGGTQPAGTLAAQLVASGPNATIILPANYRETVTASITLANSNVTLRCEQGAQLLLGANVALLRITANGAKMSGCNLNQNGFISALIVIASSSTSSSGVSLTGNTITCGSIPFCVHAWNTTHFVFVENTVTAGSTPLLLSGVMTGFQIDHNSITVAGAGTETTGIQYWPAVAGVAPIGGHVGWNLIHSAGPNGNCITGGGYNKNTITGGLTWGNGDVIEGNQCWADTPIEFCYSMVVEQGATVRDNSCYANGNALLAGWELPFAHGMLFEANKCYGCQNVTQDAWFDNDSNDNTVAENRFYGFAQYAINIEGSAVPAPNVEATEDRNRVFGNVIQFSNDNSNSAAITFRTDNSGTSEVANNKVYNNEVLGYTTQAHSTGFLLEASASVTRNFTLRGNTWQNLAFAYDYGRYVTSGSAGSATYSDETFDNVTNILHSGSINLTQAQ